MTVPKISAAARRALAECETVEDVAQVLDAIRAAGLGGLRPAATFSLDPVDPQKLADWLGLPISAMHESPPCQAWADPKPQTMHCDTLARHGAIDTNSMMFRLLKLARQERSRIEKIPFHPRWVKDDIRRRHAEILKEARAFRSFPDYRRLP